MKFLQVHTIYDVYLNEFYQRHPMLLDAPFEAHERAFLADGVGATHMFAPALRELGHDAHLIIANNLFAQYQWARAHGVTVRHPNEWREEILRSQVEKLKPEILYFGDPITFDSRFVRSCEWQPRLVAGWRAARIPPGTDWSAFDLMLSHLSGCRAEALKLGARQTERFFPGFPGWLAKKVADQPAIWDVVFSGQWTSDHALRNEYIHAAARASVATDRPFSLGLFLACHDPATLPPDVRQLNRGPVWGVMMHRTLKSGRIVINADAEHAGGEAGNMRLFEATGSGAFLLAEHQANIEQFFQPGVEIETFRDAGELIAKIHHYLAHPDEREAIARRGQQRCLTEYSLEKRMVALDALLHDRLDCATATAAPVFSDVSPAKPMATA